MSIIDKVIGNNEAIVSDSIQAISDVTLNGSFQCDLRSKRDFDSTRSPSTLAEELMPRRMRCADTISVRSPPRKAWVVDLGSSKVWVGCLIWDRE